MKIAMRAKGKTEGRWKKVVDRNYRDEAQWPSFSLADAFRDPTDLERFKQSVLALKEAIRDLDESPA